MNKTKTLSKLALVRAVISPSDILSKKSQKFILGGYGDEYGYGESSTIYCRCGNIDGWHSGIWPSSEKTIESALTEGYKDCKPYAVTCSTDKDYLQ